MKEDQTIENLILSDHGTIRQVINDCKSSKNVDELSKHFNQFVWEICRHEIAEEIAFYPLLSEYVPSGAVLSNDGIEDERKLKLALNNLMCMKLMTDEFETQFRLLISDIYRHMDKEENEYIPKFSAHVPLNERVLAAVKFENRKLIAPTRPHTLLSDKYPILASIQGMLVAPLDKFLDLFNEYPEKIMQEGECEKKPAS